MVIELKKMIYQVNEPLLQINKCILKTKILKKQSGYI